MKDFISKVTFGFLMAQLLPGAIVVFSFTCFFRDLCEPVSSLQNLLLNSGEFWFSSTLMTLIFLFISVSIGMLIHGWNWTVLAWLEYEAAEKGYETVRGDLPYHKLCLFLQIIISPVVMIYEVLSLLTARPLTSLTMDENVARLPDNKMQQFTFLQDFYLHFGQFYAHMGYAFLIALPCCLICCIVNFDWARLVIVICLYFLTSEFFLLGRIQLGSLFEAESILREEP